MLLVLYCIAYCTSVEVHGAVVFFSAGSVFGFCCLTLANIGHLPFFISQTCL